MCCQVPIKLHSVELFLYRLSNVILLSYKFQLINLLSEFPRVPEVIALPITGGSLQYLEWIKNSTRDWLPCLAGLCGFLISICSSNCWCCVLHVYVFVCARNLKLAISIICVCERDLNLAIIMYCNNSRCWEICFDEFFCCHCSFFLFYFYYYYFLSKLFSNTPRLK